MIKLMQLELKRTNLRPYLISSAIFGVIILVFDYFVANVAQIEQEVQFMNYTNIFKFTNAIAIMLFGILSAVMYARFIIDEYSGKRLALLFSYPGSRRKIFMAKVLIVFLFVFVSMLLCLTISTLIFTGTETFMPIVSDIIDKHLLTDIFRMSLVSLVSASSVGILALWVGFMRRSVTVTLISAFVLSGLYGNLAVGSAGSLNGAVMIICISLAAIFMILITLPNKIHTMEVI